jgi:hypothetical protein
MPARAGIFIFKAECWKNHGKEKEEITRRESD